jgi:predicted DsbA family dithiol-disulfide isomerase
MQVDIWSDVVCPWCYIGKRRFEQALSRFPHRDGVRVVWHSFELDPGAPATRDGSYEDNLARKYGTSVDQARGMTANMAHVAATEGLDFRFDVAHPGNTFDAHRLLHLALDRGVQDAVKERFLRATFTEGAPIGDRDTLVRLAAEAGLDADEARLVLDGDKYADEVRADEQQAAAYGITGVPFFVVDGKYGVSGAQPAELLLSVLERAHAESAPLTIVDPATGAGACDGDSCAV